MCGSRVAIDLLAGELMIDRPDGSHVTVPIGRGHAHRHGGGGGEVTLFRTVDPWDVAFATASNSNTSQFDSNSGPGGTTVNAGVTGGSASAFVDGTTITCDSSASGSGIEADAAIYPTADEGGDAYVSGNATASLDGLDYLDASGAFSITEHHSGSGTGTSTAVNYGNLGYQGYDMAVNTSFYANSSLFDGEATVDLWTDGDALAGSILTESTAASGFQLVSIEGNNSKLYLENNSNTNNGGTSSLDLDGDVDANADGIVVDGTLGSSGGTGPTNADFAFDSNNAHLDGYLDNNIGGANALVSSFVSGAWDPVYDGYAFETSADADNSSLSQSGSSSAAGIDSEKTFNFGAHKSTSSASIPSNSQGEASAHSDGNTSDVNDMADSTADSSTVDGGSAAGYSHATEDAGQVANSDASGSSPISAVPGTTNHTSSTMVTAEEMTTFDIVTDASSKGLSNANANASTIAYGQSTVYNVASSGTFVANLGTISLDVSGTANVGGTIKAKSRVEVTMMLDTNGDGSGDVSTFNAVALLQANTSGTAGLTVSGNWTSGAWTLSGNTATLNTYAFTTATNASPGNKAVLIVAITTETSAGASTMSAGGEYNG